MEIPKQQSQDKVGDDLLIGAEAIGGELGMSPSEVYYAFRKKKWPIGKYGNQLIASKSKLRRNMNSSP